MNFLAHLYLSGNDPKIMVGNFIGDFVKGKKALSQYDPGIIKGIELHRAIDAFTDTHEVVRKSKNRLRPVYRHYSGVIVDVFYDHFLARNWNDYHTIPLPEFASHCYNTIQQHHDTLPEEVKHMMPYMIRGNWLINYSNLQGIQSTLNGISHRTAFKSRMEEATADLKLHYDAFRKEFQDFFPSLQQEVKTLLASDGNLLT